MPREIKTTIAVDGEAAFKRAINEANTSLRNMGTQLTLAQAQFKKDGDAMKLMETRSKALKGEIGQQEEIVKALEKAVNDSSKAYGENSEKTEKWQAELNRAKAKLVNLQSELTLNEAGLDRNGKAFDDSSQKAADYQATLQSIGKNVSFEAVTSGIGKITGSVENAIKMVFNLAKSIRDTMVEAGNWADELMTDATKYGMGVEELQRWQNAADFIDTPVETIIGARDKLGKAMKNGWKDGDIDMWEFFGIDLKDANGKWRDKMDVMWEVGESLMNMARIDGDDVRADAYAMQIFGKSWRELLPLFTAGRDEWEKTVSEQRVVSEDHVKSLASMDDANQRLANSWETLKYSFLAEIAPTVEEITDALTNLLNEFNDWMETDEGKKAMNDLSEAIKDLFSGLKDVSFKDAVDAVKTALGKIKDALVWLKNNKDKVKTALEIIAGGFALIKVAELATNIGKIVSGFQTLWAGAKNPLPTVPGTGGTNGGSPTPTTTGGGNNTTGDVAKVGLGARLAKWLPAIKDVALGLGVEAAVVAVAVTPALIAHDANINEWREEQKEREQAAEEMALKGDENADFVREAAAATGLVKNANGEEDKNILGQSYTHMTDTHYDLLYGLQSRQNAERAKLALALQNENYRYTAGNDTWQLLQRFWAGEALDPVVVDELLENVTDALIAQSRNGLPSMLPGKMPEVTEAETEAAKEMEDAAETLKEIGEESKRTVAAYTPKSFLDMTPDEQTQQILATLGDKRMRGILHSDINAFGNPESDNINGWLPWTMLQRYWGIGEYKDQPLDKSDIDGMIEYLRQLEIRKQESQLNNVSGDAGQLMNDAVAEMKVNTESTKAAAEKVAGMDIKKFNGLPADIETRAERGIQRGANGLRVSIDGETAGRILAPYVSQYIAQNAL